MKSLAIKTFQLTAVKMALIKLFEIKGRTKLSHRNYSV